MIWLAELLTILMLEPETQKVRTGASMSRITGENTHHDLGVTQSMDGRRYPVNALFSRAAKTMYCSVM